MTKEELFKKNFPEYVTEKGACLSPFWDLFSAGIECATYELNKGCIQTLTKENAELKARLFCTKETCDNCGFVKCENFQRQRKSEPCSVYISYKDRITKLKLQLIKAKNIIQKFSEFVNNEVEYDMEHPQEHTDLWNELCEQAEQFLKGTDK